MDDPERTAETDDVVGRYEETETERLLVFETEASRGGSDGATTAAIAQNRDGYAMLKVRSPADGDERERYYGFDAALDHVAELLGVAPGDLPVPDAAADLGM